MMAGYIAAQNSIAAQAAPLHYKGQPISERGDMLSLTDMWRAAGGEDSKRPSYWIRQEGTREFIEHITANVIPGHIEAIQAVRGGDDAGTWAHWQIGLAYAKYLSPEFHAWCNQVVRDHMEGRHVPVNAVSAVISVETLSAALIPITCGIHQLLDGQKKTEEKFASIDRRFSEQDIAILELRKDIHGIAPRKEFSDQTKREYRAVVMRWYRGLCPCCQEVQVMDAKGVILSSLRYEHWNGKQRNWLHDGWITCDKCNRELETKRHLRRLPFDLFQSRLTQYIGSGEQLAMRF